MPKRKETGLMPKVAVVSQDNIQLLGKRSGCKDHLIPLTAVQQAQYIPSSTKDLHDNVESILPKVDVVELKRPKHTKSLNKASSKKKRKAFRTLCKVSQMIEDAQAVAVLTVLALLGAVLDVILPHLPGVPVIQLGETPFIPNVVRELLDVFSGETQWKEKRWKLRRPNCLEAVVPLGAVTPSMNMEDYIGGWLEIWGKKKFMWLPHQCSTVILAPNLPRAIAKEFIESSPLVLLCVCDKSLVKDAVKGRPAIQIDVNKFLSYDPHLLKKFQKYKKLISAELEAFFRWLRKKEKQQSAWLQDIESFRVHSNNDRFVQITTSPENEVLAAALALLKQLMHYASKHAGWLSEEEANTILQEYWRLVLPDSAASLPDSAKSTMDGSDPTLSYKDPDIFYRFLTEEFLPTYCNQVIFGERGEQGTMGLIRTLDDTEYFISPRSRFLRAYSNWLDHSHITPFDTRKNNYEATVQRTLSEAGIPLRGEKNNPSTWRYSFYEKSETSKNERMINCFALPIRELPEQVQSSFENLIGELSGSTSTPNQAEEDPNPRKGAEAL